MFKGKVLKQVGLAITSGVLSVGLLAWISHRLN